MKDNTQRAEAGARSVSMRRRRSLQSSDSFPVPPTTGQTGREFTVNGHIRTVGEFFSREDQREQHRGVSATRHGHPQRARASLPEPPVKSLFCVGKVERNLTNCRQKFHDDRCRTGNLRCVKRDVSLFVRAYERGTSMRLSCYSFAASASCSSQPQRQLKIRTLSGPKSERMNGVTRATLQCPADGVRRLMDARAR